MRRSIPRHRRMRMANRRPAGAIRWGGLSSLTVEPEYERPLPDAVEVETYDVRETVEEMFASLDGRMLQWDALAKQIVYEREARKADRREWRHVYRAAERAREAQPHRREQRRAYDRTPARRAAHNERWKARYARDPAFRARVAEIGRRWRAAHPGAQAAYSRRFRARHRRKS